MHRGSCLALIVALALCGCPKKDTPPQTQTVEVQPSPAQPPESNEPNAPARAQHPVVTTAREFVNAIAFGKYNRALSLTIPGEITEQGLKGMRESFQWEQATFAQVWADAEQAAVIVPVPIKQGSTTLIWAFNLVVAADGRWHVRLADLLRTPQEVEDYAAAFREVAPGATAIEIEKD